MVKHTGALLKNWEGKAKMNLALKAKAAAEGADDKDKIIDTTGLKAEDEKDKSAGIEKTEHMGINSSL